MRRSKDKKAAAKKIDRHQVGRATCRCLIKERN